MKCILNSRENVSFSPFYDYNTENTMDDSYMLEIFLPFLLVSTTLIGTILPTFFRVNAFGADPLCPAQLVMLLDGKVVGGLLLHK